MGSPSRTGGEATLASVALVAVARGVGGPCRGGPGGVSAAHLGHHPRTNGRGQPRHGVGVSNTLERLPCCCLWADLASSMHDDGVIASGSSDPHRFQCILGYDSFLMIRPQTLDGILPSASF